MTHSDFIGLSAMRNGFGLGHFHVTNSNQSTSQPTDSGCDTLFVRHCKTSLDITREYQQLER